MKLIRTLVCGAVMVGAFSGAALAADAPPAGGMGMGMGGSQRMHGAMMEGMRGMQGMQMSGNVDKDFAQMMIRHHRGAIAMAKVQVEQGKDADLKARAQKIIDDSEKDIKALQAAVDRLK
jgi:uncharacterized protein (DUF305 family)